MKQRFNRLTCLYAAIGVSCVMIISAYAIIRYSRQPATRRLYNAEPVPHQKVMDEYGTEPGVAYTSDDIAKILFGVLSESGRPMEKGEVLDTLVSMGDCTLPYMKQLMKGDEQHSMAALYVIERLGPKACSLVPDIIEHPLSGNVKGFLRGGDYYLKNSAARALLAIGQEARPAVPAILGMMERGSLKQDNRTLIFSSLVCALGITEEEIPLLLRVVKHSPTQRKRILLFALGRLGSKTLDELPELTRIMIEDEQIRPEAMWVIGMMGPPARPVLPLMETLVERIKIAGPRNDEDRRLIMTYSFAMCSIGGPSIEHVNNITEGLSGSDVVKEVSRLLLVSANEPTFRMAKEVASSDPVLNALMPDIRKSRDEFFGIPWILPEEDKER